MYGHLHKWTSYLVDGRQGHDKRRHHEIRHGQGRYQIVGDASQVSLQNDGSDDKNISHNCNQNDYKQDGGRSHKMDDTVRRHVVRMRIIGVFKTGSVGGVYLHESFSEL